MATAFPTYSYSNKRTRCPRCAARTAFAAFKGHEHFGHCFSCDSTIFPPITDTANAHREQGKKTRPQQLQQFINRQQVAKTIVGFASEDQNTECDSFEERAAIMEFDGGLTTAEANERSGLTSQRLHSELKRLRAVHPFAETIIRLTRESILSDWNIGFASDGAVLYWYQNYRQQYVNAKKIKYLPDGFHRDKHSPASFLYSKSEGFHTCLFGEHQLCAGFKNRYGVPYNRNTQIILVESEKTAIILSHHKPEFIWIASGGANGLTKEKALILRGRTVKVLYDCDTAGETGAQKACKILTDINCQAEKLDQWKLTTDPSDGLDAADLIYKEYIEKELTQ